MKRMICNFNSIIWTKVRTVSIMATKNCWPEKIAYESLDYCLQKENYYAKYHLAKLNETTVWSLIHVLSGKLSLTEKVNRRFTFLSMNFFSSGGCALLILETFEGFEASKVKNVWLKWWSRSTDFGRLEMCKQRFRVTKFIVEKAQSNKDKRCGHRT